MISCGSSAPFEVGVPVVDAPAGDIAPLLGEAVDVGGVGQVGRAGEEERPAVVLLPKALTQAPHLARAARFGDLLARLGEHLGGVVLEVVEPLVLPGVLAGVEAEGRDLLGHAVAELDQPVGQVVHQLLVVA